MEAKRPEIQVRDYDELCHSVLQQDIVLRKPVPSRPKWQRKRTPLTSWGHEDSRKPLLLTSCPTKRAMEESEEIAEMARAWTSRGPAGNGV